MKNKIIVYILSLFLLLNVVNAEKYFLLDVNYIIGSVTFNSISLREIDRTIKYTDNSGFLIKTVSFENSDIEKIYYNMSINKNYLIYIPYNENAAKMEMYNLKNSKIMDIDVSSYANTCGNARCEDYESYESCTKDCSSGSKDDFCDEVKDGICDPDCSLKTDADCEAEKTGESNQTVAAKAGQEQRQQKSVEEPKEKPNYLIWILLVLAIIVLILVFLFIKKKKDNQTVSSLRQYISENIRRGFSLQQIKDVLHREGYSDKEVDRAIRSV